MNSIIDTLFNFAKELDYDVQWSDKSKSFSEIVVDNDNRAEILYQQDGDRLIISAPMFSLSEIDESAKLKIYSKALSMNNFTDSDLYYGSLGDTINVRANIMIHNDIDDVITQYIRARQQVINAFHSSDLLSVAE